MRSAESPSQAEDTHHDQMTRVEIQSLKTKSKHLVRITTSAYWNKSYVLLQKSGILKAFNVMLSGQTLNTQLNH